MPNLYLFQPNGGGPVQCSGSVNAGSATYIGGGYFVVAGNSLHLYHVDGTNVTFKGNISTKNYGGVGSIHEKRVMNQVCEGDKLVVGRLYTTAS